MWYQDLRFDVCAAAVHIQDANLQISYTLNPFFTTYSRSGETPLKVFAHPNRQYACTYQPRRPFFCTFEAEQAKITGEMMHSHANKKYLVSTFFIFLLQKKYLKRFLHPVGLFDSDKTVQYDPVIT